MKIPMDVIAELLDAYQPTLEPPTLDKRYSRLRLVQGSVYESGTLYVGYGKDISAIRGSGESGFIAIGEPVQRPDDLIVLPDTCSLHDVLNSLQELFDSFGRFEVGLIKSVSANSYQDLIETGHQFIGNPVFFLKSGYRVIALAPGIDIPNDPEWDHLRERGFISIESIKSLKKAGRLDVMNSFKTPTLFSSKYHSFASIISNTYINSKFTGMLVVTQAFKPFSRADFFAAKMLTEALEHVMSKDEAFKHIRGQRPVYSMLHDLLNGLKIDDRLIADWMQQYLPNWTTGLFRVLFIPLSSTKDQTFDYYSRILEKNTDVCSIFFKNALVAVFHYPGEANFRSIKIKIASFLKNNGLTAGLSNEFCHLFDLQMFYKQATLSMEFGKGIKQVHIYSDYMLHHILSFCSGENIVLLCHPAVIRLKQFDAENNTQFFKTLLAFIKYERSLKKTSQALLIHRNTLLYRLDKIKDMFQIDLDNSDTRLHILLSYKLLENHPEQL